MVLINSIETHYICFEAQGYNNCLRYMYMYKAKPEHLILIYLNVCLFSDVLIVITVDIASHLHPMRSFFMLRRQMLL